MSAIGVTQVCLHCQTNENISLTCELHQNTNQTRKLMKICLIIVIFKVFSEIFVHYERLFDV